MLKISQKQTLITISPNKQSFVFRDRGVLSNPKVEVICISIFISARQAAYINYCGRKEFLIGMGLDKRISRDDKTTYNNPESWGIIKHIFSDLSCTSPVVFLYLLKECYFYGTYKATKKFEILQQQLPEVLKNAPQPGPATFIVHCLHVLPILESDSEGFSHLILSSLRRLLKTGTSPEDSSKSKDLAARLFLDIVGGIIDHDERIAVKIVEVFDFHLVNIERVMRKDEKLNNIIFQSAISFIEKYINQFVESETYNTAVILLKQFDIRIYDESFLHKMMLKKQFKPALEWATFMGESMLCALIQKYLDMGLAKKAYEVIKMNDLQHKYPDVCHKCKESSLKKLAEKGVWDIAEARTSGDRQLVEYLVYLAMEAGYSEKVDELCARYSLEGFVKSKEFDASLAQCHYLDLKELLVGEIIWVDEVKSLLSATNHIENCKVVGLDCEWKPQYKKGGKPNKVSIMQIASENMVFIFDLIKLYEEVHDTLDNCFTRILHSSRTLKLGYNFQCDIKQLAQSYGDLDCFKQYQMLLDIQYVFNEHSGGLSGLAKKILGAGLNKTRRNSDWEQRPLTQNQQEYAALDAVVLIHIFGHVRSHSQTTTTNVTEGDAKFEWKSHIISHMAPVKKSKKERRQIKMQTESVINEITKSN